VDGVERRLLERDGRRRGQTSSPRVKLETVPS